MPEGDTRFESVKNGNILAARAAILVLVCAAKACWWVLEQPSSSTMELLPVMQQLWRLLPSVKYTMAMADYGGPTVKSTNLYSSGLICPWFFLGACQTTNDEQDLKPPKKMRVVSKAVQKHLSGDHTQCGIEATERLETL